MIGLDSRFEEEKIYEQQVSGKGGGEVGTGAFGRRFIYRRFEEEER